MARTRQTIVCLFCRRRKIRCDRKKPCSSCVRLKNSKCEYKSSENYMDPPRGMVVYSLQDRIPNSSESEDTPKDQLGFQSPRNPGSHSIDNIAKGADSVSADNLPEPKSKAKYNVYTLLTEELEKSFGSGDLANMRNDYEPTVDGQFHGSLSWVALVRRDQELRKVHDALLGSNQSCFDLGSSGKTALDVRIMVNPNCKGVLSDSLAVEIAKLMPPVEVVWELITYFFDRIYCFVCFIDQTDFVSEVSKLIGEQPVQDFGIPLSIEPTRRMSDMGQKIQINDRKSYMILGQLMLVIRLSYLNNPTLPYVDSRLINMACQCINKYNIMKTHDLSYLQLLLLFKAYELYAPDLENGVDNNPPNVTMTVLFTKAHFLNIHKEPTKVDKHGIDGRINNIRRKIWYFLMVFDNLSASVSGNASNFFKFTSDIQTPYLNGMNANNNNPGLEDLCISSLQAAKKSFYNIRNYCNFVYSQNENDSVKQLNYKQVFRDNTLFSDSRIYQVLVAHESDYHHYHMKTVALKFAFQNYSILLSIYIHKFNYFHSHNMAQSAHSIIALAFNLIYDQLLPMINELIGLILKPQQKNEEDVAAVFLYSSLQSVINKILIIHLSLYTKTSPDTSVNHSLSRAIELFLGYYLKLSSRCDYSSKMYKAMLQFYKYIQTHGTFKYNISYDDICPIIDQALSDLELTAIYKDLEFEVNDSLWFQVLALN